MIFFAIGYSEPSRRHRPRLPPDEPLCATATKWVINGQKMWTSLAELRRLHLARGSYRSRSQKKHRGLSIFMVPTDRETAYCAPGDSSTVGGVSTNATFYDGVRVPARKPDRRRGQRLAPDHWAAEPRAHLARRPSGRMATRSGAA